MRRLAVLATIITIIAAAVRADTVILKDGSKLSGDVKKTDGGYDIIGADGHTRHIATDQVRAIELGGPTSAPTPSAASDRLTSLRRSVESVGDVNVIIQ